MAATFPLSPCHRNLVLNVDLMQYACATVVHGCARLWLSRTETGGPNRKLNIQSGGTIKSTLRLYSLPGGGNLTPQFSHVDPPTTYEVLYVIDSLSRTVKKHIMLMHHFKNHIMFTLHTNLGSSVSGHTLPPL